MSDLNVSQLSSTAILDPEVEAIARLPYNAVGLTTLKTALDKLEIGCGGELSNVTSARHRNRALLVHSLHARRDELANAIIGAMGNTGVNWINGTDLCDKASTEKAAGKFEFYSAITFMFDVIMTGINGLLSLKTSGDSNEPETRIEAILKPLATLTATEPSNEAPLVTSYKTSFAEAISEFSEQGSSIKSREHFIDRSITELVEIFQSITQSVDSKLSYGKNEFLDQMLQRLNTMGMLRFIKENPEILTRLGLSPKTDSATILVRDPNGEGGGFVGGVSNPGFTGPTGAPFGGH